MCLQQGKTSPISCSERTLSPVYPRIVVSWGLEYDGFGVDVALAAKLADVDGCEADLDTDWDDIVIVD